MDQSRLATFSEAYVTAVLQAIVELNLKCPGKTAQEYAVDLTLGMAETIERHGLQSVAHYVVNTRGGAFRHTAETLGVPVTGLQHYLDGGN